MARNAGLDAFDCYGNPAQLTFDGATTDLDVLPGQRRAPQGPSPSTSTTASRAASGVWPSPTAPGVAARLVPSDRQPGLRWGTPSPPSSSAPSRRCGGCTPPTPREAGSRRLPPAADRLTAGHGGGRLRGGPGPLVTITALDVRLPITLYVAPTFADADAVLAAILAATSSPRGPGRRRLPGTVGP
ncbi:MAG: hypothetical protein R3F43_18510 [bacterium]